MMKLVARVGLLGLAVALSLASVGCRKRIVVPEWTYQPRNHPTYPESRYIVGSGRSEISPFEAEQAARGEVARQIRSDIEMTARREVEVVREGDRYSVGGISEQKVLERAEFEHAEMIRVPADGAFYDDGVFWAFAYLDRLEADRFFATEQGQVEDRLRNLHQRAMDALREGQPGQFVKVGPVLLNDYDTWDALRSKRRAIAGGSGGDTGQVDRWAAEVHAAQGELVDRMVWVVHVQAASDEVAASSIETLEQVLVDVITNLGLTVVVAPDEACSAPTGDRDLAFAVTADLDVQPRTSGLGPAAALLVTLKGSECFDNGGEIFAVTLDREAFVGEHATRMESAIDIANGEVVAATRDISREIRGAIRAAGPMP